MLITYPLLASNETPRCRECFSAVRADLAADLAAASKVQVDWLYNLQSLQVMQVLQGRLIFLGSISVTF